MLSPEQIRTLAHPMRSRMHVRLRTGVRDGRVRVMPAHGLCLEEVGYPPEGQMAARVEQARARRGDEVDG